MSDFDKEAERERLREKYEADQRKRESSERMSDLLLKGATMTNAHCNECGDPIFRYDGEEFCPTCQRVVTNDEAAEQPAEGGEPTGDAGEEDHQSDEVDQTPDENGESPAHIEIKQPDGPAVQTGGTPQEAPPEDGTQSPAAGQDEAASTAPAETGSAPQTPAGADEPAADTTTSSGAPSGSSRPEPSTARDASAAAETGDDFDAARASLLRTLREQAEHAEATDDPRRARDHLAAAREAAEALSALSSSY